ncbi:MAG: hypothetical protein Q8M02_05745 [Candidatus Didemnitutus sp.]|nr:hypothetical protein [Candidatus Didemnitutus sp.]
MNRMIAQQLLRIFRPTGGDAHDPCFAQALNLARHDAQLREWLNNQRRTDRAISQALRSIPVPPDLRATILAGARAGHPTRAIWWRRAAWPVAAGLILGLSLSVAWSTLRRPSGPAPVSLAEAAHQLSQHQLSLGLMSGDVARIRSWLAARSAPMPDNLPSRLAGLMLLGCQEWDTPQGKVSLLCFVGDERRTVLLFVFERPDAFGELPPLAEARAETYAATTLMLWRDAKHGYALGPFADPADARALLSGPI